MRIEQISTLNPNLAARNDIQLSHYRSPENERMVTGYQFSARGTTGKKSTVELLELLCRAVTERLENRFLFQATYGHGKSHFGLALANFFGKPESSPEIRAILDTIQHVSNDAARVGDLKSFKANHKPFLVLMVRGDTPGGLRDKVFRALDEALSDHGSAETPPFWFGEALNFLNRLDGDNVRRAEAFLEDQRLDLDSLRKSLEQREGRYYELCHELFKHIYGSRPDFGSETSLSEALGWAADTLCGKDKEFGGVLVLFDEFSVFVKDYTQQTGVPLQELLNGVEQQRGKIIFVAFSQHEPERLARDDGSPDAQSLIKELNRLPHNNRHTLQASLEDVLRHYFKEDEIVWRDFLRISGVGAQISEANDVAFEAFKSYYQRNLGWSSERFQESITKDCFPLHPLTTVLLSNLQFEQAATTRSVIGFLTDDEGEVKSKLGEEALVDGKVNWVLPVSLVDYFEDMLSEQVWAQYQGVRVPDLSDAQNAVLKAMVLQRAAEISTKSFGPQGFEIVIGQLAGLSPSESKKALESLEQARYIRYDSANRTYSFWVGSNGAVELERLLNKRMDDLRVQTDLQGRNKLTTVIDDLRQGTNRATELMDESGFTQAHSVAIKWGHPDDWAADEVVLSRAGFTQRNLEHLLGTCMASVSSYAERRGAVILLLAENQADIEHYETKLEAILDSTAALKAAPFVVMLPKTPNPELKKTLLKYVVLNEPTFVGTAVTEIGRQVFDEERKRMKGQLEAGFDKLRADARFVTTLEARGRVRAVANMGSAARRLELTLKELFSIVYHKAPESFFTQYKHMSGNQMRNAVVDLIPVLEANNVINAVLGKVAKELVDKFLAGDWAVLSRQFQLQVPTSPRTESAWSYLDKTFIEGEAVNLDRALSPLLNAPYGYDYNTLTLLFASWYGLNKRDLEINVANRTVTLSNLTVSGKSKPDAFIKALGSGRLWRRKRSDIDKKVQEAAERIETGNLTKDQAQRDENRLKQFLADDDGSNSRLSADAGTALNKVTDALARLTEYDALAVSIDSGIGRAKNVSEYAAQLRQVDRLPQLFTVRSDLPLPEAIRKNVISRLQTFAEIECEKNEKLSRLTDYGMNARNLRDLKRELERLNLSGLETRVGEALTRLDEAKDQLEARRREQQDITAIEQLQTQNVGLAQLLEHQTKLDGLSGSGTESVREAARRKLEQVRQKTKDLRDFSVTLPGKIDALRDAKTARSLVEEVLQRRGFYEGTADLKDLDTDKERIVQLEAYFTELERRASYRTRAEADGRQAQLLKVRQNFAAGGVLHDSQAELVEQELQKLAAFVRQQESEAQGWLDRISDDLAAGRNLRALRSQLAAPHGFLPEALRPQLTTLAEQVDATLAGEAQESQRVEAVRRLPANGTVVQLRETLRQLERYENDTERVRDEAGKKRASVETELRRLTEQLTQWQNDLARVTSIKLVNHLAGAVQRAESLYQRSDLEDKAKTLVSQVEMFGKVIQDLETPFAVTSLKAIELRRQCLNDQQLLTELLPASAGDSLRRIIAKQQQELDERVAHEEVQFAEALERLAAARNTRDVETLDARLSGAQTFFADSEHAVAAAEALQRSVTLKQYFADLHRTESAPAGTPADLSAQQRSVEEVCNCYKEHLQDAQRSAALLQLDRIADILKRKQDEARAWLGKQQERLARAHTAGELNQLEHSLQSAPAFLPDELQHERADMQRQVASRLDGLQLEAIEDRFKKLDSAKRAACLQRLEKVMRELEAV